MTVKVDDLIELSEALPMFNLKPGGMREYITNY